MNYKCPYCGQSNYTFLYAEVKAIYRPFIFKDGKCTSNQEGDLATEHYHCFNCDAEFTSKDGLPIDSPATIDCSGITTSQN